MRKRGLRKGCRVSKTHGRDGEEGENINDSTAKDKEKNKSPIPYSTRQTVLVVAALIATVTFAAGFTLPGGYVSGKGPLAGTAVLRKKVAFQAFIIMDTTALILASYAVISQLLLERESGFRAVLILKDSFIAMTWAMIAMVIAFITGVYAVLEPSNRLHIAIFIISILFFFNSAVAFSYDLVDLIHEIYNPVHYQIYNPFHYRVYLHEVKKNILKLKPIKLFGSRNKT